MPRTKPDLSWTRINIDAPELFPIHKTDSAVGTEQDTEAVLIPRDSIEAGSLNARQHFPPETLRELGESMREHGQLQPILVRLHPRKEGKYEIVAGERRWRAAGEKYADLPTLRCRVGEYTDAEVITLSVVENINREDLTPTEKGRALLKMKQVNPGLLWPDIARMVSRTRQWVNDCVSLVEQPEPVRVAVDEQRISPSHARAVRQLPPEQQVKMVQAAIRHNLTREQLAERVKEIKAPAEPKAPPAQSTPALPETTPEPAPTHDAVLLSERRTRATQRLRQCVSVMAEVAGELLAMRLEAGAFSAAYKAEIRDETRLIAAQQDAIIKAMDGKRVGEAGSKTT